MLQISVHSSSGNLPDLIIWICSSPPLYNHRDLIQAIPERPSGFPYFFQFKPRFCNRELTIWATVSSRSFWGFFVLFCWLYRASTSSATKNIINLILMLTIWWCPHVELSLTLLQEGVCYDSIVLLAKLLVFALHHYILPGQTCLLLQVSLDFVHLHSISLWWKQYLKLITVLEGLVWLFPWSIWPMEFSRPE